MANITKLTLLKLIELIVVLALVYLHFLTYYEYTDKKVRIEVDGEIDIKEDNMETHHVSSATFGGYVVIIVGLFAGDIMSAPVPRQVDLFFSLLGYALFMSVGAFTISNHDYSDNLCGMRELMMWKGGVSIALSFVFLLDAYLTYKGHK